MKKILIWVLFLIIIVLFSYWFIFGLSPTKAEVERFLDKNSCNPSAIETEYGGENYCANYIRRHTTLLAGQIFSVPMSTFLFIHTPFHYFNYILPGSSESHTYILVVTRDKGPLVYNSVNGNFIGSYDELMLERGCKIQEGEDLYLANQKCDLAERQRQVLALKLKGK